MKTQIFKTQAYATMIAVLFIVVLWTVPVLAEETVNIQLRIEGPDKTFLNTDVSVPEICSVIDITTTTPHDFSGYKAICALQAVQEQGLLTYQVTDWGWGFSLDKINETANAADWSQTWIIRVNNATAQTGIDGIALNSGDNLLITYGPWPMEPLQIISSTSTPEVNTQLNLQTKVWDDTSNDFVDFINKSIFWIGDNSYESSSGTLSWFADAVGSKQIRVEADGKTRSESRTINIIPAITTETTSTTDDTAPTSTPPEAVLATTTISLQIIGLDQNLYSNEFVVTACQPNENSSSTTLTPYCALQQVAEQNGWDILFNDYGGAKFLAKINQYDGADWNWWAFFHNLDFASEALNQYELQPDDDIFLSYGVFPLKLETSTTTPGINTTTTLSVKEFGFDSSWAPAWLDAASSTVIINNISFDNPSGIFELFINTSTPYEVHAAKNGFIDSKKQILTPLEAEAEEKNTENNNDNGNNSNSNPTAPTNTPLPQDTIKTAGDKILNYLKSQQDETGKIIDANISDWAVIAFAANNQYAHDIKSGDKSLFDFALAYDFTDPSDLNICATYPRHILALLSAGVDKNSAKLQELKTKIKTECYKNNAFGLAGINDDIFGLFGLLALDESPNEPIVSTTINTILADQQVDGSFTWAGWPGADITGAAINALKYAQNKGAAVNNEILTKAKNYLKSQQLADGGWGYSISDALTTGWAVMGINALGEGQNEWFNSSDKNPWHPLINLINAQGYYEPAWAPGTADWFATKHAAPALLGKSWPIILPARQEETNIANNSSGGGGSNYVYTPPLPETPTSTCTDALQCVSTPTTTLDMATTTSEIATTSTDAINRVSTDNGAMEQLNNTTAQITNFQLPISKQIQNSKKPINHSTIKPLNTSTPTETNAPTTTYFLSAAPSSTPLTANPSKTVFGISLTMASGLGLYLAWRLIQTVV